MERRKNKHYIEYQMTINCNYANLPYGNIYTEYELRRLKSNYLVGCIYNLNKEQNRDFMVFPMSIYNILELNDQFINKNILGISLKNGLYLVGRICNLDCYLDIKLMKDEITLHYKIDKIRDFKIDNILSNSDFDYNEYKIDVII